MLILTVNMSTVCLTEFDQKVNWLSFGKILFNRISQRGVVLYDTQIAGQEESRCVVENDLENDEIQRKITSKIILESILMTNIKCPCLSKLFSNELEDMDEDDEENSQ